jgi:hypothetical protein
VKLERSFEKPARAWFLVVFKRKPQPLKVSYLLGVFVSLKVNDVGDAQVLQPFHVGPCGYSTAKGQAFSHEENFHLPPPPGCLEINCFTNAQNANLHGMK